MSNTPVWLRPPSGEDELFLAEIAGAAPWFRAEAAKRLAPPCREDTVWEALPFADVDAALLALRRYLKGDRILTEVRCESCRSLADISISIEEYLAANAPCRVRGLELDDNGIHTYRGSRFRVPTTLDVVEESLRFGTGERAADELSRRCAVLDDEPLPRTVSRVLDSIAPILAGIVDGGCPTCGATIQVWFEPGAFVLEEFRIAAGMVVEQAHLLAATYGWSEESILAMPSQRRQVYAAYIVEERTV